MEYLKGFITFIRINIFINELKQKNNDKHIPKYPAPRTQKN